MHLCCSWLNALVININEPASSVFYNLCFVSRSPVKLSTPFFAFIGLRSHTNLHCLVHLALYLQIKSPLKKNSTCFDANKSLGYVLNFHYITCYIVELYCWVCVHKCVCFCWAELSRPLVLTVSGWRGCVSVCVLTGRVLVTDEQGASVDLERKRERESIAMTCALALSPVTPVHLGCIAEEICELHQQIVMSSVVRSPRKLVSIVALHTC